MLYVPAYEKQKVKRQNRKKKNVQKLKIMINFNNMHTFMLDIL